jgi:myotubularin-related protein 6/7/8
MVGLTANRSIQDEKLIEAIFQSHHSPESKVTAGAVYGATATNLIIDARPTTNAVANTAKGAGTENMDHYKEAKKAYLGIDNIHVVRDALGKVVECLQQADSLPKTPSELSADQSSTPFLDRQALRRSGWLKLLSAILEGTLLITRNVHVNSSHVLIHCSDGWDRTAQLSALSQICLDPYYRTIRGFQVLVEKDWVSFGHRFLDRCGHLSSDKFFVAANETQAGGGGSAEAAQAFFASVQNRFTSQGHVKEMSPVFHQFLECVRQIQRQFPNRFEYNERFLRQLHTHLYSCQFGNFLNNNERERRLPDDTGRSTWQRTISVWDFINSTSEMELNRNVTYDKTLDDPSYRGPKPDMGVLLPDTKDIRFWHELYGRTDEEMNGKTSLPQASNAEVVMPIEAASEDPVLTIANPNVSFGSAIQDVSQSPALSNSPLESETPMPPTSTLSRLATDDDSRTPSPSSFQRQTARANTQDTLGAGVKSMWGRLSSNASAAFTVVQGAYDGVSRDLRNMSVGSEGGVEGGGELRTRDQVPDWGSSQTASLSSATASSPSSTWGITTQTGVRLPSTLMENPWNTERQPASQPQRPAVTSSTFSSSPWGGAASALPNDPTIADPASMSHANTRTASTISDTNPWATGSVIAKPDQKPVDETTNKRPSTDPLGIGPL